MEGVGFGGLRNPYLLFADDVVLLASSYSDLQLTQGRFAAMCDVDENQHLTEGMALGRRRADCTLRVREALPPGMEEFKYLWVFSMSVGTMERLTDALGSGQ